MNMFFVLALGRSGTTSLAHMLEELDTVRVHHEPWHFDPKLLSMRYAGVYTEVVEGMLEERFAHLLPSESSRIAHYGEVNSYLRYEHSWLQARFNPAFLHLVRDGRDFVRSAYVRLTYTARDNTVPIVPRDGDPYAGQWRSMSRFEKLCWYWNHTNSMLADCVEPFARFEDMIKDYAYFQQRVLQPLQLAVSRDHWEACRKKPQNTTRDFLRRFRKKDTEHLPPWPEWEQGRVEAFWNICGKTMKRLGYS
jgi:hypothetical protein